MLRRASSWALPRKGSGKEADEKVSQAPLHKQENEEGVRAKGKAIKTERSQTQSKSMKTKLKVISKSAVERELIETSLKGNFVFAELNSNQLDSMVLAMERIKVKSGTDLIVQGDAGDFFYVVETGTFDFIVYDNKVGQCGACGSFGELALLYDTRRAATVRCTSAATVFALNRETFKYTLSNDVKTYSEEITEALSQVPMFSEHLRLDEIQRIADVIEVVKYPAGSEIIKKGDIGTTFYIIKDGEVVCTEIGSGIPDISLAPGKYFGERSLISKDPRAATVMASEDTTLLSLNGLNFHTLLDSLNTRMTAAAQEEDIALKNNANANGASSMMDRLTGRKGGPTSKKTGWTLTTRPDIQLDSLQEVARLGSGSFGYVRMVVLENTDEVFALKSMLRADIKEQRSEQSVLDEKELMAELTNPFIVNLVNTYKSSRRLYMLMECVQGGELYSRIHTHKPPLDKKATLFYAANIAVALSHIHSKEIVYRDLKPENVLLDSNGYLKICDFGFAVRLGLGQKTYTLCGTVEYLAPELLIGKGHNRGVDWWAFGVLVYEMLSCRTPFEDKARKEETTMRNILKQQLVFPDSNAFDDINKKLITKLLTKDPLQRIGSEYQEDNQVMKDAYFKTINFESIINRDMKAPWIPSLSSPTDSSHFDPDA